jgi:16S rRNA processing protein RimM
LKEVEVARVVKPHGLKGEVGVIMLNEQSDLLEHVESVTAIAPDGSRRTLKLESAAPMGRGYRVKFMGCDDRTCAETLRELRLAVCREELPELQSNETYLVDLIGARVFGPGGEEIGEVIELQSYPSVDALVIRTKDGTLVEQPWVTDWVESVDVAASRIVLNGLEGLL